jgi:hypothetical protein
MKNGTRKKANNATASPESRDLRAEIARRSYEIWLNEGAVHGCDLDHWLRAERELGELPLGGPRQGLGLKTTAILSVG